MTFVNELIPEEQKDKFDPEMLYINAAIPTSNPSRWTIDRERDMFLIRVGATRIEVQANPGECEHASLDFYRFSFNYQVNFAQAVSKMKNKVVELVIISSHYLQETLKVLVKYMACTIEPIRKGRTYKRKKSKMKNKLHYSSYKRSR